MIALAAALVAAAYAYRLAFDRGRAYQRRRSALNPGQAILLRQVNSWDSLLLAPADFANLGTAAHGAADEFEAFYRNWRRDDLAASVALAVDHMRHSAS